MSTPPDEDFEARFTATLWRYPGPGGWVFVTVPESFAPAAAGAFGRTPVLARIDGRPAWATSVWKDRTRGTLLAVPRKQRGAKDHGDTVEVEFRLDASRF